MSERLIFGQIVTASSVEPVSIGPILLVREFARSVLGRLPIILGNIHD
jgi:hypothetical protein